MTPQFTDMTPSSIFFDVVLFLLSSLATGSSFIPISSLVLELWQFTFIRDWPEIRKWEIPAFLVLPNILRMGQVRNTKLGTDVSNKMLLNAAKCQGYNIFRFWVFKRKPTRKGFIVSDHIDKHWKTHTLCPWYTKIMTFCLFPLHGKLSSLPLPVPKWFSAVYIKIIYCHVVIINQKKLIVHSLNYNTVILKTVSNDSGNYFHV